MVPKLAIPAHSQPLHGASPRPLPVLIVAGFSQAARHRVIQQWLRSQPSCGDRPVAHDPATHPATHPATRPTSADAHLDAGIAWLDHQDRPENLAAPAPTQSFLACVCCSGSLVFTTHLTRLLREQRWRALVISLGASALPSRIRQQLSGPAWAPHLGPLVLVSLVDGLTREVAAQPDHRLYEAARQQLDASDRLLETGHPLPPDVWPNGA